MLTELAVGTVGRDQVAALQLAPLRTCLRAAARGLYAALVPDGVAGRLEAAVEVAQVRKLLPQRGLDPVLRQVGHVGGAAAPEAGRRGGEVVYALQGAAQHGVAVHEVSPLARGRHALKDAPVREREEGLEYLHRARVDEVRLGVDDGLHLAVQEEVLDSIVAQQPRERQTRGAGSDDSHLVQNLPSGECAKSAPHPLRLRSPAASKEETMRN
mmetsp:Transcript_2409/g.5631  ORF Transcript_2409/g.5631 Transcript_2409/m.5631 type:complete len:213 (-) Transcript_2409:8-646(-)